MVVRVFWVVASALLCSCYSVLGVARVFWVVARDVARWFLGWLLGLWYAVTNVL